MKSPLIDKIVHHLFLQYPSWVAKGELTAIEWRNNDGTIALPETVGRKCREAEELKQIAVKKVGKSVAYKWIPHEMRELYIPTSIRVEPNILFRKKIYE